jgi:hypothetical protein
MYGAPCFVNKHEKFSVFWKIIAEKFGGYHKSVYLCIRFRSKTWAEAQKKEFFERFS